MKAEKIFEALASSPRRQVLAYLSSADLTTSDLAKRFEMSSPSMSRHLAVLENAGLVTKERDGQRVLYKLTADNMVNTLSSFVFEICPVGRPLKRESKARSGRKHSRKSEV